MTERFMHDSVCGWCGAKIKSTDVNYSPGRWASITDHRCELWDDEAEAEVRARIEHEGRNKARDV